MGNVVVRGARVDQVPVEGVGNAVEGAQRGEATEKRGNGGTSLCSRGSGRRTCGSGRTL